VPIVLKSGSFNLLEPSGSVQACDGIALPLRLPLDTAQQPRRFQPSGTPVQVQVHRHGEPRSVHPVLLLLVLYLRCRQRHQHYLVGGTEKNRENFKHPGRRSNQAPANNVTEALPLAADIAVSSASVILISLESLQSPDPHCGGPGSIPGQSMWNFWWTNGHWGRVFSQYFAFLLSACFPWSPTFICLSPTLYYLNN
jgi:hypothetical protein